MMALGFDGAIFTTFGALLYGATLLLKDPNDPLAYLKQANTSICTPSMLASLNEEEYRNFEAVGNQQMLCCFIQLKCCV